MFNGIQPYQNNRFKLRVNQSIGDIITGLLYTHEQYKNDYDIIAPKFEANTIKETCKKIYDFLLNNTHYVIESNDYQTLRSPGAILHLGKDPKIGLDCKSYSLFIGGILSALQRKGKKINWCYRFASYKITDKLPHHVFVVVNPGTDNEIYVDPVIQPFNYKKPYFYKIDKKPNMALYQISGIGIGRKTKKSKAEKQQAKQKAKEEIKKKIKKTGGVIVKYAPLTVAGRNSFLLLVKLNVFKLAEKLAMAEQKAPGELKKFWEKLGGNWASLKKNINIGGRKSGASIGSDPATATAISSAIPILVKIREFLKKLGLTDKDLKDLTSFATDVVKDAIDKKAEKMAESEPQTAIQETAPDESFEPETEGQPMDMKKILPILAVAGIGAYFLLKKK